MVTVHCVMLMDTAFPYRRSFPLWTQYSLTDAVFSYRHRLYSYRRRDNSYSCRHSYYRCSKVVIFTRSKISIYIFEIEKSTIKKANIRKPNQRISRSRTGIARIRKPIAPAASSRCRDSESVKYARFGYDLDT